MTGVCTYPDCIKVERLRKGYCGKHYKRLRLYGDPSHVEVVRHKGTPSERFWAKVVKAPEVDGCWVWQAQLNKRGYGVFYATPTESRLAHRFSYTEEVGPIQNGLELDHLCRNHACVRPKHLEAVPHRENVRRGQAGSWQSSKTHCKQGHEFSPENTRRVRGGRECIECHRKHTRDYMRKRRSAR